MKLQKTAGAPLGPAVFLCLYYLSASQPEFEPDPVVIEPEAFNPFQIDSPRAMCFHPWQPQKDSGWLTATNANLLQFLLRT